jgi:hypothetical protein
MCRRTSTNERRRYLMRTAMAACGAAADPEPPVVAQEGLFGSNVPPGCVQVGREWRPIDPSPLVYKSAYTSIPTEEATLRLDGSLTTAPVEGSIQLDNMCQWSASHNPLWRLRSTSWTGWGANCDVIVERKFVTGRSPRFLGDQDRWGWLFSDGPQYIYEMTEPPTKRSNFCHELQSGIDYVPGDDNHRLSNVIIWPASAITGEDNVIETTVLWSPYERLSEQQGWHYRQYQ